ncbi:hypothetical protein C8R47DRAFT_1148219 [Mycena vitilis]|nr:hypothetical protein C8R47DRAFT_1148219 [Mycena vitilis]
MRPPSQSVKLWEKEEEEEEEEEEEDNTKHLPAGGRLLQSSPVKCQLHCLSPYHSFSQLYPIQPNQARIAVGQVVKSVWDDTDELSHPPHQRQTPRNYSSNLIAPFKVFQPSPTKRQQLVNSESSLHSHRSSPTRLQPERDEGLPEHTNTRFTMLPRYLTRFTPDVDDMDVDDDLELPRCMSPPPAAPFGLVHSTHEDGNIRLPEMPVLASAFVEPLSEVFLSHAQSDTELSPATSSLSTIERCPECPDDDEAEFTEKHLREKGHRLSLGIEYKWKSRKIKVRLFRMRSNLMFSCICDELLRSEDDVVHHFRRIEAGEIPHKHTYTRLGEGKLQ